MKDTFTLCFSLSAKELIEFEQACQALGLTWEEWFRQSLNATTAAALAAGSKSVQLKRLSLGS